MKHLITIVLALTGSLALTINASTFSGCTSDGSDSVLVDSIYADNQVYGIAFYNLENLFDTINSNGRYDLEFSPNGNREWNTQKYRLKINNLANAISSMVTDSTPAGPSIIGIAEVENESVVKDLVNAVPLRGRALRYVHRDSPDPRGIDVALLYDPMVFKVIGVESHTLRVDGNPDFRTRDQLCVSGILGGVDTLSVIVNHWPSRLGGQSQSEYLRVAAAELSRSIADSIKAIDPWRSIIIMGDLNDDPRDKSCAEAIGARRNAYDVPPTGFYNPWWNIHSSGKGTLTYRGEWNLFDQIIVCGAMLPDNGAVLTYTGAEICDIDFLKQKEPPYTGYPHRTYAGGKFLAGYSDHFPTQIFVRHRN